MKTQRTFYGYKNCVVSTRDPGGDYVWFFTRKDRDAFLREARECAVGMGLSEGAARAGIYPVKMTFRDTYMAIDFAERLEQHERYNGEPGAHEWEVQP